MNYEKNFEILSDLEKAIKGIGGERPVNFEIKGRDGKLTKVSKEEFAWWMVNEKPKKESLVYAASGDIDSITTFIEIRSGDEVIKASHYRPRGEEEKEQIKKRQEINRKRREQENKKDQGTVRKQEQKLMVNQSDSSHSNFPTGWVIGGGVLLATVIGLKALLFVIKNKK